jgi:carbonic anhydrase
LEASDAKLALHHRTGRNRRHDAVPDSHPEHPVA